MSSLLFYSEIFFSASANYYRNHTNKLGVFTTSKKNTFVMSSSIFKASTVLSYSFEVPFTLFSSLVYCEFFLAMDIG